MMLSLPSWEEFNWNLQGVNIITSITLYYNIICSTLKYYVFQCVVGMRQRDNGSWRTSCMYIFTQHNPIINTSNNKDLFSEHIFWNVPLGFLSVGGLWRQTQHLMNIQWDISECQLSRWGEGDVMYVNLLCCCCSLQKKSQLSVNALFFCGSCFDATAVSLYSTLHTSECAASLLTMNKWV